MAPVRRIAVREPIPTNGKATWLGIVPVNSARIVHDCIANNAREVPPARPDVKVAAYVFVKPRAESFKVFHEHWMRGVQSSVGHSRVNLSPAANPRWIRIQSNCCAVWLNSLQGDLYGTDDGELYPEAKLDTFKGCVVTNVQPHLTMLDANG
jgi:hypothetical protein